MKLTAHDRGVVDIGADELRAYMQARREADYLLVDVRQPEEYEAAHIPGAKLVPLMELQQRAGDVGEAKEQNKIFYCHSGGRSRRAASFFGDTLGLANVFNLVGGISAYEGRTLPNLPVLKTFAGKGSPREILLEAINLEKGADRLYRALAHHFRGSPIEAIIRSAARAEEAHGRAVYEALKRLGGEEVKDFDTLYAELPGDVLEGGATFHDMLGAAKSAAAEGSMALLDLALDLELSAYDLYRNLAHRSEAEAMRQVFLDLAEQEKGHARALTSAIARQSAA